MSLLDLLLPHSGKIFVLAASLLFAHLVSDFVRLLARQHLSPLNNIRGPTSSSWISGNLSQLADQENNGILQLWEEAYGPTYVYRGFLGGRRLLSTDPVVLAYILGHAYDYPKPDFVRDSLASMSAGHQGLLCTEGEQHQRQRRILTPAFTSMHVKSLAPIFFQKATQLRDTWLTQANNYPKPRIDVLSWLSRATLDVIGLAGFGYVFEALTSQGSDELARAFGEVFAASRKFRLITILQAWFPILRKLRRRSASEAHATSIMRRIGLELIAQHGATIDTEKFDLEAAKGRNLLSVLIGSNRLASTSEKAMSEDEILCQISTFIAAGHETTAAALSWCLYALSRNHSVQDKLREELLSIPPSGNEAEAVANCQYLEWVVRETLRLYAPATSTMRVCTREVDEIPVGPAGYVDRHGVRKFTIPVSKGDIFTIPIQAVNKSKALWGEDALAFRPERWDNPLESIRSIPGLYFHTMTFLNNNGSTTNGNRSCIGWRFAILEIKIFLYVLLRFLRFSIDPNMIIEKRFNVVMRPFVKGEPELENQMPLYIEKL